MWPRDSIFFKCSIIINRLTKWLCVEIVKCFKQRTDLIGLVLSETRRKNANEANAPHTNDFTIMANHIEDWMANDLKRIGGNFGNLSVVNAHQSNVTISMTSRPNII